MDFKMMLLFVVFLVLSVELTSGSAIKRGQLFNKEFCMNHIFHPRCRGQQQKRDVLSHPSEDFRLAPLETDLGLERRDVVALINLGELLRKAVDTSREYDPETVNYLK